MKRILALLLAVILCILTVGCASKPKRYEYSSTHADEPLPPEEIVSPASGSSAFSDTINITTTKGSFLYMGCEAADYGTAHGSNGIFFQFRFINNQDQAAQCQSAFRVQAFQDGVELATSYWAADEKAEQNALYQSYCREVPAGKSAIMGRPFLLTGNSPVILRVQDTQHPESDQWMLLDLQEHNISVEEDHRFDTAQLTPLPNAINLSGKYGDLMYVGAEPAAKELSDLENLMLVSFVYTNTTAEPRAVHSAFRIKYYQNNEELTGVNSYYVDSGVQYHLVSRYYRDVLENGANLFSFPIVLTDDSPVTIIAEEFGDPNNYQIMELPVTQIMP